ncbi:MAG: hypothetical protein WD894_21900 [Pirellulales bacterium]
MPRLTMSPMKWKLMLAGVFVACAFGAIALRIAWATPGSGITIVPLLPQPVPLDDVHIQDHGRDHGLTLKTRGGYETRVNDVTLAPGGHSGWHSHPGLAFVLVTQGTLTHYEVAEGGQRHGKDEGDEGEDGKDGEDGDDKAHAATIHKEVFPAGTGFVEQPNHVHIVRNEGSEPAKFIFFTLYPQGQFPTTDEPQPEGAEF